jgi:hypothetical protein
MVRNDEGEKIGQGRDAETHSNITTKYVLYVDRTDKSSPTVKYNK